MTTFTMLIGPPASGKSSYAKNTSAVIVSTDAIREELYGSEEVQDNPQKVFDIAFQRVRDCINGNQDCILDATNVIRKYRISFLTRLRSAAKASFQAKAIVFATPLDVCLDRNKARRRIVPEEVIHRMIKNFNVPWYSEGFDEIEVFDGKWEFDLSAYMRKAMTIPHDNPHHSLTIGEHCMAAAKVCFFSQDKIYESCTKYLKQIYAACYYHDIGKPYCKTFTKLNGNPSPYAHYYFHENVGAYMYLCYRPLDLITALLINFHMSFFNSEKHLAKIKDFLGEELFTALEWVHKFDVAAH